MESHIVELVVTPEQAKLLAEANDSVEMRAVRYRPDAFRRKICREGSDRSWIPSLCNRLGCVDSRGRSSSSTRDRVPG